MDSQNGYRQWSVPENPRAILLLVHGLGAHSGRWEAMGDFFLGQRIASYGVECPDDESCAGEILRVRQIISLKNPGKKIFLIGESLGGLVSLLAAFNRPDLFDGLICISPAFNSRLKLSVLDYFKIFTALLYNPKRPFHLPFDLSMCTRDKDFIKKMELDTRERRWASSISLVKILLAQIYASVFIRNTEVPTLFLIAGDDKMVSPDASVAVFKHITAKDKVMKLYPGMYHALSIDIGKETVFQDILVWVEKRI